MQIEKGFILTRNRIEDRGQLVLHYYGTGESGPFLVIIDTYQPVFFVPRKQIVPGAAPVASRRSVELTDFNGESVDAVYFSSYRNQIESRKLLRGKGVAVYESDILPEERYLMERFINGSVEIQGGFVQKGRLRVYHNPLLKSGAWNPSLTTMSVDIETGQDGSLYTIGYEYRGNGASHSSTDKCERVLFAGPGEGAGNGGGDGGKKDDFTLYCGDEKAVLKAFLADLAELDPDVLIGWHVIGFDLMFIRRKCEEYRIPFTLGRNGRTGFLREIRSGGWAADIPGRIVIDGPPSLRAAFYSFENFRLETVARELLGVGKDIGGTDRVEEIERRYREDPAALAYYNLMDCRLVTRIMEHTGLISQIQTRARLSGLQMDKVGMSVAAFDYFMLPQIHRKGLVAPDVDDIRGGEQAAGGLVFSESPGFYQHVAVLDFKSLYPTIIRTFYIDPVSRLRSSDSPVRTPAGIPFSTTQNVLPGYIAMLMRERAKAREEGNSHLAQGIKILMNSFYGVMGTTGSRFYHPDLPTAITSTGQWFLRTTRDYLKDRGYEVIYGDTDSVFVCLKESEYADPGHAGRSLADEVNRFLKVRIQNEFQVESRLEIEFEKHFSRFFLPALRGSTKEGACKRYAGLLNLDSGGEKLVFTGMEYVRSDWTKAAREFQFQLFDRLFHGQEVEEWIRSFVSDLKEGKMNDHLVYKKRLTKKVEEYTKTVPPHVKAAQLLGSSLGRRREIRYLLTRRGPVPEELPHEDIDYQHYIDKQLKPIADAVLSFGNLNFDDLAGDGQLSLF